MKSMNHGAVLTHAVAVGTLGLAISGVVLAQQQYPVKPLLYISPFAPGTGPDLYTRPLMIRIGEQLGQPVVQDNRVGLGGAIAVQQVLRSAPDGYTMSLVTIANFVQRFIQKDLGFDPLTDLAHVSQLTLGGSLLVVPADSPYKSVEDLLAAARSAPGKLNYGSGGAGTPSHMPVATLAAVAGLSVVHIPYKNSADVVPAILRGDLQFSVQTQNFAMPHVRSGKLRILATTNAKRFANMPETPTLFEIMKNELLVQETWAGICMVAKTPMPLVRRLHAEIVRAMQDPGVQKGMDAGGSTAYSSETPEVYVSYLVKEYEKARQLVKLSGVNAE
jgi:tripartite-type tricarboxylate transporter receptor subunit TctC